MRVYKKPMGLEEEEEGGMRLRRRLPRVRVRVRLLLRSRELGLGVVGGGRGRMRWCLSGIRDRRCSGGWGWWVGLVFECGGDGAATIYPHKTRPPSINDLKALDKIKLTL